MTATLASGFCPKAEGLRSQLMRMILRMNIPYERKYE